VISQSDSSAYVPIAKKSGDSFWLEDLEYCHLLNVRVHALTIDGMNNIIGRAIEQRKKLIVAHANVYGLNIAYKSPAIRSFLNSAELVYCDGAGVRLAARLIGDYLPPRITLTAWVWQLSEFAEPRNYTFYFLGARPGIAALAAVRLQESYPQIQVVGTKHGYFDKGPNSPENKAIIADINKCRPNILIVGLGMPRQERWLQENWDCIDANVALTGGAVFDYMSGELRRAPRWMTDNGLEWLGRLIIEPRRLWRRYVIGNPLFLWRVLKQRFGLIHFE
jgi:N-acetylglucosaminyldiphosphoundecaprenol N-acetyl-beta-D-mannosaminyltransferase